MPLLLTPAQPLLTPCQLPVGQVYAIVNTLTYERLLRRASFTLGYYLHEAGSLPDSGVAQLSLPLPTGFSFTLAPAQVGLLGDPQAVLEAYAQMQLSDLLPGATIENVP